MVERVFYTDETTTPAMEVVKARITEQIGAGGWLVELLVDDIVMTDETEVVFYLNNAFILGRAMIERYLKDPLKKLMYSVEPQKSADGKEITAIVVDEDGAPGWMVTVFSNREVIEEMCVSDDISYAENYASERVAAVAQPPADVDMGGDFEGFVEAVNQPQAAQEPIDRAIENGTLDDYVMGRIEEKAWSAKFDRKAGLPTKPRKPSIHAEQDAQIAYQHDSETKMQKRARLTAQIARLDRERESLAFELSQLQGE